MMAALPRMAAVTPFAPHPTQGRGRGLLRPGLVVVVLVVLGLFVPSMLRNTFYLGLLVNAIILGIAAVVLVIAAFPQGLMGFLRGAFGRFGRRSIQAGGDHAAR